MLPGQVQALRCMETGALRTAFLLASSAGLVVEPLIGAHPHLRTQVHVHVQTHAQQGFDGRDLQSTGELKLQKLAPENHQGFHAVLGRDCCVLFTLYHLTHDKCQCPALSITPCQELPCTHAMQPTCMLHQACKGLCVQQVPGEWASARVWAQQGSCSCPSPWHFLAP